jgi:hypothetical protein
MSIVVGGEIDTGECRRGEKESEKSACCWFKKGHCDVFNKNEMRCKDDAIVVLRW